MYKKVTILDDVWPRRQTRIELQTLSDADFRELLRRIRKRLVGHHGIRKVHTARKKAFNHTRRKLIGIRYPGHHIRRNYSRLATSNEVEGHPVLDALYPKRTKNWKTAEQRYRNQKTTRVTLKDFSLIDNPIGTLQALTQLVTGESLYWKMSIDFEDDYCLDIGPYLILGVMRERMAENCHGGKMSAKLRKVIQAVDLDKFLGIRRLPMDTNNVWPIKLERGKQETIKEGEKPSVSRRQIVTDRVVEGMNEWLANVGLQLSDDGKIQVGGILGETIDNAERHSQEIQGEAEWFLAGFMARRPDQHGQDHFVGHIGILSLGRTVAKSLAEAPNKVRIVVDDYISKHKHSGLNSDSLATVCALQDTISRDPDPKKSRGGVGFMDIINFTADLGVQPNGQRLSNVAILSGKCVILAQDPYACGVKDVNSGRREQWFNKDCSLEFQPDSPYVLNTNCDFPGTLVSMRFELHKDYLTNLVAENGNEDRS